MHSKRPPTQVYGRARRAHARRRNTPLATAVFVVFLALVACGDPYGATNPYDPDFPVVFTITGPDTLFSVGEFAQYSVQTVPPFPDTAFRWAVDTVTIPRPGAGNTIVDGASILVPSGPNGAFILLAPPLEPATATIAVEALVGSVDTTLERYVAPNYVTVTASQPRHIGFKQVVVTQRLARIQLRCPATHACDTLSVGSGSSTWSVWVDGFDARNNSIASLPGAGTNPSTGPPIATYTVRDTTIASVSPIGIRAAAVLALKPGTTWIVATRGALLDSLQLVAR